MTFVTSYLEHKSERWNSECLRLSENFIQTRHSKRQLLMSITESRSVTTESRAAADNWEQSFWLLRAELPTIESRTADSWEQNCWQLRAELLTAESRTADSWEQKLRAELLTAESRTADSCQHSLNHGIQSVDLRSPDILKLLDYALE